MRGEVKSDLFDSSSNSIKGCYRGIFWGMLMSVEFLVELFHQYFGWVREAQEFPSGKVHYGFLGAKSENGCAHENRPRHLSEHLKSIDK